MDDTNPVLLLVCRDQVEADLARNVLQVAGIPCVFVAPDFDFAELGRPAHSSAFGAEIRVSPADLDRARAALEKAWGHAIDGRGEFHGTPPGRPSSGNQGAR